MAVYEDCSIRTISLAVIGIITLICVFICIILKLLNIFNHIFLLYCVPNQPLDKKFGSWAVITGCTDGIGKAYAKELASRGINLVLISRSKEKLKQTANEFETEYGVQTKIIPADFSMGQKALEIIQDELQDIPPIGILVNNVGKQYSYPMFLGEVPEQELWDIININVGAVTMMTRLLIQGMKERGRGAIVNVSSASECQPLPLMNVYAASKVYIKHFTEALRQEYSKHGITVQHLSPFFINTKMNQFSDRLQIDSLFVPDPTSYAKYAVNTLGKVNHSTGYWTHGIQYFFTNLPPMGIRMKIGETLNNLFREDYLRQKREESAVTMDIGKTRYKELNVQTT